MSKADGRYIVILFTADLIGEVSGSVSNFIVRGKEYDFVPGGTLIDKVYTVTSVERVNSKTIRLTVSNLTRFHNSVGELTVEYNGAVLAGVDGVVLPFNKTFTPEDLIAKPNQNMFENITISNMHVTGELIPLNFPMVYLEENIEISSLEITGKLIHIDDI